MKFKVAFVFFTVVVSNCCYAVEEALRKLTILRDESANLLPQNLQNVLELSLNNLKNRFNLKISLATLHPKSGVNYESLSRTSSVIVIAGCRMSQIVAKRVAAGQNTPFLFIELEPCKFPTKILSFPLTWAEANLRCFVAAIEHWVQSRFYNRESELGRVRNETAISSTLSFSNLLPEYCDIGNSYALTSSEEAGRKFMKDKTLLAGILLQPPFVLMTGHGNGRFSYFGSYMEICNTFSQLLQFNYSLYYPVDGETWEYVNIALNEQKILDFLVTPTYISPTYGMEFSTNVILSNVIVSHSHFTILIPSPKMARDLGSSFRPFAYEVWLSLMGSAFVIALLLWLCYTPGTDGTNPTTYSNQLLYTLSILICQAGNCPANKVHNRVVVAAWCLTSVIFVYTYSSMLISFITVPKAKPIIDSVQDLANRLPVKPSTVYSSLLRNVLQRSKDKSLEGLNKVMGDYADSGYYVNSLSEGGTQVLQGTHAFVDRLEALNYFMASDFQSTRKCRLMVTNDYIEPYITLFEFRKNFAFTKTFDRLLLIMSATGLRNYWDQAFIPYNPCKPGDMIKPDTVLTNSGLGTAYLILAGGFVLTLLAFIAERMRFKSN